MYTEVEKLRNDQRYMENEYASFQLRWANVREEKSRVANRLEQIKRIEEELDRFTEEKNQIELEEKVIVLLLIFYTCMIIIVSFS